MEPQGKGAVSAAKAVENQSKGRCLSRDGSGNTRQRQCLTLSAAHIANGSLVSYAPVCDRNSVRHGAHRRTGRTAQSARWRTADEEALLHYHLRANEAEDGLGLVEELAADLHHGDLQHHKRRHRSSVERERNCGSARKGSVSLSERTWPLGHLSDALNAAHVSPPTRLS